MSKAQESLDELRRIATATLRQANVAARHEGLVLVDAKRLEKLELLAKQIGVAADSCCMTREYRGADDHCNGKRYLLRREEFSDVLRTLMKVDKKSHGPMGWAVPDGSFKKPIA